MSEKEKWEPEPLPLESLTEIDFGKPLEQAETDRIFGMVMDKVNQEKGGELPATASPAVKPMKTKRKYITGLAACAALFLALTVTAVAYFQLDGRFQDFLHLGQNQYKFVEKAGNYIGAEAENQGYRLVARESIGDRNKVYILLDLIAPEGEVLSADFYEFQDFHFDIISKNNFSSGFTVSQLPDDNLTDNKVSFVFEADTSTKLVDADIFLRFSSLVGFTAEEELLLNVDGSWDLEFPLHYEDVSLIYYPNRAVDFNGGRVQVEEIYLSPLSLSITLRGAAIAEYDRHPPKLPSEESGTYEDPIGNFPIKLILADGSILDATRSQMQGIRDDKLTRSILFNQVIEMSDVVAVEFLGETIYLNN